ncbi:unannotated protein [freshwater metagenome]|uniref:Unannotated protein n=1 Tax=freshwater metagenome TaxID=449393 RepID=A0A6J7UI21_9ZZZZ
MEQCSLIQVELLANSLTVSKDLGCACILHGWHIPGLFQQRKIGIGLHITHAARVAIPIPSTTKVAGLIDDSKVSYSPLQQIDSSQHACESSADDHHLGGLGYRLPGQVRVGIGVTVICRIVPFQFNELLHAIRSKALLSFLFVALSSRCKRERVSGIIVRHGWAFSVFLGQWVWRRARLILVKIRPRRSSTTNGGCSRRNNLRRLFSVESTR